MFKKIFLLFFWFFVFVFVLFVCYVIGVFRNWIDIIIVFYWIFVIFVIFFFKFIMDCIYNYFFVGKYRNFLKFFFCKKRVLMFDLYFKKGLNIISKRGRGEVFWFLFMGDLEKNNFLFEDINFFVFYCNCVNSIF